MALSGGGFRAMLFHAGTLLRLNDWGLLRSLATVSSVSGGSIAAGVLGLAWKNLRFDGRDRASNLRELVVDPLRRFAKQSIDVPSVVGLVMPGGIAGRIEAAYRRHLFGDATLQALPNQPEFIINATNMHTGNRWGFSKKRMGDSYLDKYVLNPELPLARAVAASSAFTPFLSPVKLAVKPAMKVDHSDIRLDEVVLTDGGVYDNLGLQPLLNDSRHLSGPDEDRHDVVLVSDGGKKLAPKAKIFSNWAYQYYQAQSIMYAQVRSRRTWALVEAFNRQPAKGERKLRGGLWAITTTIDPKAIPGSLDCPTADCKRLSTLGTRLAPMDDATQMRLINWGYAVCDYVIRRYGDPTKAPPDGFPYPGGIAWPQ